MTPIYERTIVGTWLLGFMLVMAALMAAVILLAGDSNEGWWTPLIMLAMPLVFGVMRVSVGRDSLRVGTPDPEALVKALDRARRRHAREE